MNNNEARELLRNSLPELYYKTESHFLKNKRPFGIAGMNDSEGRLTMFRQYNDRKLDLFIEKYELPPFETDEKWNLIANAVAVYLRNIYKFAVIESQSEYNRLRNREILVASEVLQEFESTQNVEGDFMDEWVRERIKKINTTFKYHLTYQDKQIYALLLVGKKGRDIAEIIYPDKPYDKTIENKVNYRIRLIQYRYAAWVFSHEIFTDHIALAGLNRFPAQNKRFFGEKKLLNMPSKEELVRAAKNEGANDEKENPQLVSSLTAEPPKQYSKVDFNGKAHDHFVVYAYSDGTLFDHVTKTTRKEAV